MTHRTHIPRIILTACLAVSCTAQTKKPQQPAPQQQTAQAGKPAAPSAQNLVRTAVAVAAPTPDASAAKIAPPPALEPRHEFRRDPFVNPIVKQGAGPVSNCTTGKHCLMVGQLNLKGIIISREGILAIVENAALRTYFLRVNDPLFDGVVTHITRDSVTFQMTVTDSLGRPIGTREVVKKIVVPAA